MKNANDDPKITVRRKIHFVRRERGKRVIVPGPSQQIEPGRIPRISRLMALAIHCDRLIRGGKVTDLSELARLCHVTQPRMTQIMNLNHLAPDIQEEILHLAPVAKGRSSLHERRLRQLVSIQEWSRQRKQWSANTLPVAECTSRID